MKHLFSLFFICISLPIFAQRITQFPENPDEYIDAVFALHGVNTSEAEKLFIEDFRQIWNGGELSDSYKKDIVSLSNTLLAKKARGLHYWNLWKCYLAFNKSENSSVNYAAWLTAFQEHAKDRRSSPTSFNTLIVNTSKLLEERKIVSSTSADWIVADNAFRFDFKDSKLYLIVPTTDLTCFSKGDSLMILSTSGTLDFNEQTWQGKGGKITWERAGIPADYAFATLSDYAINMKKNEFEAENVMMFHKRFFPTPVAGKLVDKVRHISAQQTANYPEFTTNDNHYILPNVFKNVNFEGRLHLKGASVLGQGSSDADRAKIHIKANDSLQMEVRSKTFSLQDQFVNAQEVEFKIQMGSDSITHPSLTFAYVDSSRLVSLRRSNNATSQSAYIDSYHQVSINADYFQWNIDSTKIELLPKRGLSGGSAEVRSLNYFNRDEFDKLYGMDQVHPLVRVNKFVRQWSGDTFPIERFASANGLTITSAKQLLLELAKRGYIIYGNDSVRVLPNVEETLDVVKYAAKYANRIGIDTLKSLPLSDVRDHDVITFTPRDGDIFDWSKTVKFEDRETGKVRKDGSKVIASYQYYDDQNTRMEIDRYLKNKVQPQPQLAYIDTRDMTLNIMSDVDTFSVAKPQHYEAVRNKQEVLFIPDPASKTQVKMYRNRDMEFDGTVDAGRVIVTTDSSSLRFNYETFELLLTNADSVWFAFPKPQEVVKKEVEEELYDKSKYKPHDPDRPQQQLQKQLQREIVIKLNSTIYDFTGRIQLDTLNNKSGIDTLKSLRYPILISDSISKIYYTRADSAYDPKSFYFELDPFRIDSLNTFNKDSLCLHGKFISGGVFDTMEKDLRVQPDFSLGFEIDAEENPLKTYGDAKFTAKISLSNSGLTAKGNLDYLTASINDSDFKIYPDSMKVASATNFEIRKQVDTIPSYPHVQVYNAEIHWNPKQDEMHIKGKDDHFSLFDEQAKLSGSLMLTRKYLAGNGTIDIGNAKIESKNIALGSDDFRADNSTVSILGGRKQEILKTVNVESNIDLINRRGTFHAQNGNSRVLFPESQFAADLDGMFWDMDAATIFIGHKTAEKLKPAPAFKYQYPGEGKGTRFFSRNKAADSLNFVAAHALFDINSGTLKAEGVNLVRAADAVILLSDGKLSLTSQGELTDITDAKIVFNEKLKQHTIHSANVQVQSRNHYSATGKYDYIDMTGKVQTIDIAPFESKNAKTVATGTIAPEDSFKLSPFYKYHGNLILDSDHKKPIFGGFAQITTDCNNIDPQFFYFKAELDEAQIKIPLSDTLHNDERQSIVNGFFLANDSTHVYPALFSKKRSRADKPILVSNGFLSYNPDSMKYFIAQDEKLKNRESIGSFLALDCDKCLFLGEGPLNLHSNFKYVNINTTGTIQQNLNNRQVDMNTSMMIDFYFDNTLISLMTTKIDSFPELSPVDVLDHRYKRDLTQWLGTEQGATFHHAAINDIDVDKRFPKEMLKTFVLTDVNFRWNQRSRSFRSYGKIGIAYIAGKRIYKKVDGVIEITKRPGGDFIDIYLQLDPQNWFYFGYTKDTMFALSSEDAFNDRLLTLPAKNRRAPEKKSNYTFSIAPDEYYERAYINFRRQQQASQQELDPQENLTPVSDFEQVYDDDDDYDSDEEQIDEVE